MLPMLVFGDEGRMADANSTAQQTYDAVRYAAETGRLDLATALLAAIAVLLALGGLFAFLEVRRSARAAAVVVAKQEAETLAEAAAVAYLERELPRLIQAYEELARNAARDEDADAIAEAQEDNS